MRALVACSVPTRCQCRRVRVTVLVVSHREMTVVAQPHQQGLQTYARLDQALCSLATRQCEFDRNGHTHNCVVDIPQLYGVLYQLCYLLQLHSDWLGDKLMTTTDRTFLGS